MRKVTGYKFEFVRILDYILDLHPNYLLCHQNLAYLFDCNIYCMVEYLKILRAL